MELAFKHADPVHESLSQNDFNIIRRLAREACGINLSDQKYQMVLTRLGKRLSHHGFNGFGEYIALLQTDPSERQFFINALTTNKTEFFRENDHFELLQSSILPKLKRDRANSQKLRFWCAASSTGQEIYTVAMVLDQFFGTSRVWDYKVLGTDIDTEALESANRGIYTASQMADVPEALGRTYFLRGVGTNAGLYQATDYLKSLTKFRQLNLVEGPLPTGIVFDVIFLRNVLIYFDTEVTQKVINRLSSCLCKNGHLFIGHSETLNGIKHDFKQISSAVYRKT